MKGKGVHCLHAFCMQLQEGFLIQLAAVHDAAARFATSLYGAVEAVIELCVMEGTRTRWSEREEGMCSAGIIRVTGRSQVSIRVDASHNITRNDRKTCLGN